MHTQSEDVDLAIKNEIAAAVDEYEDALAANDLNALSDWFSDEPDTVRADAEGLLVGRESIDEFRRRSPGALPRRIERLHIVPLAVDAAIAVAATLRPDGTRGLQTQAWVRTESGWRIAAAHVSVTPKHAPAATSGGNGDPAHTSALWRVKGAPLVSGARRGSLSGRSVAVKDLFAVAGYAVGAGNPTWLAEAAIESENAAAVQSLLDAGADVVGIAQTDEFAYSLSGTNAHYGTPPNPAAVGRVTGGSSSGPASAVALGLADIGLGTDTAGSIRVPASYCGLFGLRPTHGAVATAGLLPLAPGFDTVGWMTRDAQTLEAVADVLLPHRTPDPMERVLIAEDLFALADPSAQPALRRAAHDLTAQLGFPVHTISALCDDRLDAWTAAFGRVQAAEAWAARGQWLEQHPHALEPEIAKRFAVGREVTPEQLDAAQQVLADARGLILDRLRPGTVLMQPAASTIAPPAQMSDQYKATMRAGTLRLTCLASIAGLPAVAMPAARVQSQPIGLCLVGAQGSDRALVALVSGTEGTFARKVV